MYGVNLSRIYMEITRRYRCSYFDVVSTMAEVGNMPVESVIEFQLPKNTEVDQRKLCLMLEKHIKNVKCFNLVVEDDSIFLILKFHKKRNLLDTEYEYSLN